MSPMLQISMDHYMTILPLHMALAPRLNSKLLRKTIHGVHARQSRESETDSRATNQWLVRQAATHNRGHHCGGPGWGDIHKYVPCKNTEAPGSTLTTGGAEKTQKFWGTSYPPAGRPNSHSSKPDRTRFCAA